MHHCSDNTPLHLHESASSRASSGIAAVEHCAGTRRWLLSPCSFHYFVSHSANSLLWGQPSQSAWHFLAYVHRPLPRPLPPRVLEGPSRYTKRWRLPWGWSARWTP